MQYTPVYTGIHHAIYTGIYQVYTMQYTQVYTRYTPCSIHQYIQVYTMQYTQVYIHQYVLEHTSIHKYTLARELFVIASYNQG